MPRSSDSVAALGSALAKAQAVLVNPEKSLTATVPTGRGGEGEERTFRYASLASGLDIVRKTLSQHEIAALQTTAIDQPAGIVNLTTMLVHASGEWIASDWPVCLIGDLASPRRMGAALTYARRYALFTLVGIAGEDDLDAPDLQDRPSANGQSRANGVGDGFASASDIGATPPNRIHSTRPANGNGGRGRRGDKSSPPVILDTEQSGELRDRLLSEIVAISSTEEATNWARNAITAKNTLSVPDAQTVEEAFERRLTELSEAADAEGEITSVQEQGRQSKDSEGVGRLPQREKAEEIHAAREPVSPDATIVEQSEVSSHQLPPGIIDKSVLVLSEPKRHRNKEHLRFVAQQACLICGRTPSDPHHLRFAQARALGRKVSDEFVVPLCRTHHRALHRVGNEPGWWLATGINPLDVAGSLWGKTRLIEQPEPVTVQAPAKLDYVAPDLPCGDRPRSEAPRRGRGRPKKSPGPTPVDGRML